MHVRHGLLGVLLLGPGYGQQLARELERRTGIAVNAGQISSTLERLARDGLVADAGDDTARRRRVTITPAGRDLVDAWVDAGEDADAGATLALLASVDGELALRYAAARRARLADRVAGTAPAVLAEHRHAVAEAELRWLERWSDRLAADPSELELGLDAEPRRGRPQRSG